jgi:PPM family protein phosphatase
MVRRAEPFPVAVLAGSATDVGKKREENEDAILAAPEVGLYVVADGAGGHNAGKVASALVVTSVRNYFGATEAEARKRPHLDRFGLRHGARRLACAVQKANHDVIQIAATTEAYRGMGSTIVAVAVDLVEPMVHVAHVGDSRCYRVRDGHLDALTHDHSLLNDVLALKPDLPDAALARLPGKVVTRALGMEAEVRISVRSFEVVTGDTFLLCSDGLSGEVAEGAILDALLDDRDPGTAAAHLVGMANHAGGRDNIAALVLQTSRSGAFDRPAAAALPFEDTAPAADAHDLAAALAGLEIVSGVDESGQVRTVPLGRTDRRLLQALGALKNDFTAPASAGGRRCPSCNAPMGGARYCPQCGA